MSATVHHCGPAFFAVYPMVQVMVHRWGHGRPGMWSISLHCAGLGFTEFCGVMDDFGNLVAVSL